MANPQMEINPLVAAREACGLSLTDLADRTGIASDMLRSYETNPARITLAHVSALAAELRADAMDLVRPLMARVT